MALKPVAMVLVLGCGLCVIHSPASAATRKKKAEKIDVAARGVETVLRAEVAGEVDRRERLAETLKQHPDSAAARWHAGFVRDGDAWRTFDSPASNPALAGDLNDYRRARDEAPLTYRGQLDLANWCRKQRSKDRERAHLSAALSLSPVDDQAALLERLGYVQIGTQWVSDEQICEWRNTVRQAHTSLKKWASKLERIAPRLGGSQAQRDAANAELRAAADLSAIPAIEFVLAGRDEMADEAAVEVFRRIDGPEVSLALARQAVFSSWPGVRKSAAAALKNRLFEDFVPALVGLLARPTTGSFRLIHDPSQDALYYSYAVAIETENQFQVATLQLMDQLVEVRTTMVFPGASEDWVANFRNRAEEARPWARARAGVDAGRSIGDRLYPREIALQAAKDRIQELNARVIEVLSEISGSEPTPDPRAWWKWWYDYTDAPPSGTKPVTVVEEFEGGSTPYFTILAISCFAGGTPVWTESGPVRIDAIKVGDRVLAQDIQSGELSYKPVLATTANPPKDLLTLRVGAESIICTKGHRFWTSGSGWTKARDLEPQSFLHTAAGNAPVWSVKPARAERTHNLVVDGFHTYFVGNTAILCQDLRSSNGANRVVPGLARK